MKKFFLVLFAVSSLIAKGQLIFEAYANNEEVSYISISPKMFEMLGKMMVPTTNPEAEEFLKMVQSISNFKVLISANGSISDEMFRWVKGHVQEKDLEELMIVTDNDADIYFYVKESNRENFVELLLMFAYDKSGDKKAVIGGKGIESVLMLIEGNIDLNQISKLTEKMDLPGGEQLKKAGKNNSL